MATPSSWCVPVKRSAGWLAGLVLGWSLVTPVVNGQTPTLPPTEVQRLEAAGLYADALPLAQQALEAQEQALGPNHLEVAAALMQLANLQRLLGLYPQAESLYSRALGIRETALGLTHPDVADTLVSLASIYRALSRYPWAEPLYNRALAIEEQHLGPDHPQLGRVLNNLANLFWEQGNYDRAEALHRRALAIREKHLGPEHPKLAVSLNNLAVLYEDRGDFAQSETLHRRALAIRERALGLSHPDVAVSLHNLGDLYVKQGRLAEAEPLYRRSLDLRETLLGTHREVAASLGGLARLYRAQGRYWEAEPLNRRALAIFEQVLGPQHPDLARSLHNLALLHLAMADVPRALDALERSLDIQERNLELLLATGTENRKRAYLATLSQTTALALSLHLQAAPGDPRAARLALDTVLRRKGRVLDALADNRQIVRERAGPQEKALLDRLSVSQAQLAALVFEGPGTGGPGEHRDRIARVQAEAEKWEEALQQRSAQDRVRTEPATVAAVQKALPADGVLLELVRYQPVDPKAPSQAAQSAPARYAVAVLAATGDPRWTDLGEAAVIEPLLTRFRGVLADPASPRDRLRTQARQLDERMLQPIRAQLGTSRRLLVAPDGLLNLLPLAALVDERGRFLLESYDITYLSSGRDLLRLRQRFPVREPPLLVANPDFGPTGSVAAQRSRGSAELAYRSLPQTAVEAVAIKRLLPEARLLTGTQATENALKRVQGALLLHVATHGFFLREAMPPSTGADDNPLLRSGLALAGFNTRASAGEDGALTALEASNLDLLGTELVVLSACDTGTGQLQDGEGVFGLRRALTIAGARSQVISLWKVDDQGTRLLMEQFYRRLLSGVGRSEALGQAQKQLLTDRRYAHPYYWAAFIPSGDWRPLLWGTRSCRRNPCKNSE